MESKTKKLLITTGIIGALSFVAYKVLAKSPTTALPNTKSTVPPIGGIFQVPPSIEDISIYTNEEIKAAADKIASNNTGITYTPAELADLLQQDFNGNGTNWSAGSHGGVVGILLRLNSDADFDNLNSAYGIRPIKAGFITSLFVKPYVGDMNGAFNSELSQKEIADVNDILNKKGLTRRITIV
jgi:hypothetical protein